MNKPRTTLTGVAKGAVVTATFIAAPLALAQHSTATIDRYVAHVSSVPANEGETVALFVREKLSRELQEQLRDGGSNDTNAVLFVHGSLASSIPVFDLPHEDYSWMTRLAEEGFDTFAMEHSGFGWSARPAMDDPCNLSPEDQAIVTPNPLTESCEPSYGYTLTNSESDWDEIDTVVDYIRALRGVDRVSLVGWSRGGPRTAGYAARHPEKVDKLVLLAPAYSADAPSAAPRLPQPGNPMRIMTREMYTQDRWHAGITCDRQVAPGVEPIVWQTIMDVDKVGATWGPKDGVMRVSNSPAWGWNREYAAKVDAPTLILVGEQDFIFAAAEPLYTDLIGAPSKYLINMECATHYAFWERFHYTRMQDAAIEWLTKGTYQGQSEGIERFEINH